MSNWSALGISSSFRVGTRFDLAEDAVKGFLPGLSIEDIRFDVLAGLTTAAVVIPKSMAYAIIAGLPVQAGLYVAVVPMFVYAILGTSRQLSVSTTTTLAILTGSQLALVVPDGDPSKMLAAASALALLSGGFLLLAGILRLGFLANFISDPVLTGFKAGIGLVIVVEQLPKMLGVHIDKSGFFRNLLAILEQIPHTNLPTQYWLRLCWRCYSASNVFCHGYQRHWWR